jgi:hypothetical protein
MILDTRWDRFTHTRAGRAVVHPIFIACMALFMVASATVSVVALTTAWHAKSREIAVARVESAHAVAKANQAQLAAQASEAHTLEQARTEFCHIVHIYATAKGTTTERGQQVSLAWEALGRTPFLHCAQ